MMVTATVPWHSKVSSKHIKMLLLLTNVQGNEKCRINIQCTFFETLETETQVSQLTEQFGQCLPPSRYIKCMSLFMPG